MLILFVIGPCVTIQVEFANSAKELRRKQCGVAQTYTLRQGESTFGKPYWISSDGKKAIWYAPNTKWLISGTQDRGSTNAEVISPSGYSSPVDQSIKWKWYDNDNRKWMPYTTEITVICSSGK